MKTDRINTTQFNITSVQDDQSEIKLSSGRISVDLLHKRAMSEDEGIYLVICYFEIIPFFFLKMCATSAVILI